MLRKESLVKRRCKDRAAVSRQSIPDCHQTCGHNPIHSGAERNIPSGNLSIDQRVMQNIPDAMHRKGQCNYPRITQHPEPRRRRKPERSQKFRSQCLWSAILEAISNVGTRDQDQRDCSQLVRPQAWQQQVDGQRQKPDQKPGGMWIAGQGVQIMCHSQSLCGGVPGSSWTNAAVDPGCLHLRRGCLFPIVS